MSEPAPNALLSALDPAMLIVTAASRGERSGCLVAFAMQSTIEPPSVLVAISILNRTFDVAERASGLAMHLLRSDQHELAQLFGATTGDEIDKFARCSWHDGMTGAPVLDDCSVWLEGEIQKVVALGDHVAFHLRPVDGGGEFVGTLLRQSAIDFEAGHPPEEMRDPP